MPKIHSNQNLSPLDCSLGKLKPDLFACKVPNTQPESVEQNETPAMSSVSSNMTYLHEHVVNDTARMCGPPEKLEEYLHYRKDRSYGIEDDEEGSFISGTEIQFSCIESAMGERKTWKIVCDHGVWVGRSTECGK